MHLSVTQLVSTLAVVAGLTASTTSAHSIHRRGAQHHHKDLAERMAQPAATSTSEGDSTNFYARALNDAQAGRYRITRRSPNPAAGKPGQRKVIRKRGDGATCRIRSTANATESAVSSSSSADVSATSTSTDPAEGTNVNNWWAATTKASSSSAVPTPAWTSSSAAWSESSAWVEPSSSYAQYASSSASSYYSESPSSSSAAPAATETSTSSGHGTAINQVTNNVLLALRDATCGECGATPDAPNGSEDWINCGMKSANGWTPPKVTYDQLRVGDATKLQSSYPACSDEILAVMTQVSAETGVPAQLLLSIAIRESACRVDVRGGGGEVGLMQVAENRCPNHDIGSCMNIYNNIKLGADIFNEKLSQCGNSVFCALGAYNGWTEGMTYDGAHNGAVCSHNRNRDYVHSIVNGFMQGVDASNWSAWGQNGC